MDVRCPQCETLYEIDERQLRSGSATLKCSQCERLFRLETDAQLSFENQRRWMVRTTGGDVLYFSAFDALHRWIMDGTVTKDDQISRTGKKWTKLAEIGEFMPIFQAVDSISSISGAQSPVEADASPSNTSSQSVPAQDTEPPNRARVKTSQQFSLDSKAADNLAGGGRSDDLSETSRPEAQPQNTPTTPHRSQTPPPRRSAEKPAGRAGSSPKPVPPESGSAPRSGRVNLDSGQFGSASPAEGSGIGEEWSFGDEGPPVDTTEHSEQIELDYGSSSRWPMVVTALLVVVVGSGVGVWVLRPDLVDSFVAGDSTDEHLASPETDEPADEVPTDESPHAPTVVSDALAAARQAIDEAGAEYVASAIDQARPALSSGIEEAADAAKEAAEEPDLDEVLEKAQRYLEHGYPERARVKFYIVLEEEADNVAARTGLAWTLLAMDKSDAAAAQFRRAIDSDSGNGDAYIGLGKAERERGRHQQALEAYRNYLSRFPAGRKASIAEYQANKLEETLGR